MKSLYSSLLNYLTLLVLLQTASTAFSQSPNSISGFTFDTEITSGTGPYATSGRYRWILSESGTYTALNITGTGDETGNFVYQRTAVNSGRMSFNDRIRTGFSQVFTYQTTNSGTFALGNVSFPGLQQGKFKSYSGTAPESFSRKVIWIQSPTGNLNFGGGGLYRIVTLSTNSYIVQNASGTTLQSGVYSYSRPGRSTGLFQFQDTTYSSGIAAMTFDSTVQGSSFLRATNGTTQMGVITSMSELRAPTFLSHPVNRSVTIGQTTTISVVVNGTGPITYQWYKNDVLLGGVTGSSYTIPAMQFSDEGSYKVVASNIGGVTSSLTGILTPVCAYSLSTNVFRSDYKGGAGNVTVIATGNCPWSASTTNSWITFTSPNNNVQGTAGLAFSIAENTSHTARMGYIQAAGKTLVIAQGTPFAPIDLAGKTFLLRGHESEGLFAATGTNLVLFSSGTNEVCNIVAPGGGHDSVASAYAYERTSNDSATIAIGDAQLELLFTGGRIGTFSGLNAEGNGISGEFKWSQSAPDFNQDNRGDIVWQGGNGAVAAWFMEGSNFLNSAYFVGGAPAPVGWRGVGLADFNRDGNDDVVFQDGTGRIVVWLMSSTNRIGTLRLRDGLSAGEWRAFSVTDVNNDGRPDVLFQHTNGKVSAWLFNGTNFIGGFPIRNGLAAGSGWQAIAAVDLNGDAQTDILFQHTNGKVLTWYLNGGAFISSEFVRNGLAPVGWRMIGAGDFNEDGSADLIWQSSNNQIAVWLMNGTDFSSGIYLRDRKPVPPGWKVVGPK